jgi:hypothetical protein
MDPACSCCWVSRRLRRPRGRGPGSVFEPVSVAFEGDDLGVVDEAVDHGGGDHFVAEGLAPAVRTAC